MSGFLLDTNVLSEFNRRGEPDAYVKEWLGRADPDSVYVSVVTLGEIRFGVELLPPSKRRSQLERWLEIDLAEWFEGRILPIDRAVVDRWGLPRAQAQTKGRPLPVIDALLAATALAHGLTVVSRNADDFQAIGLPFVNPWLAKS